MAAQTHDMDASAIQNRAAEARKYMEISEMYVAGESSADWKAAGSNAVQAGIAAADAICGKTLGYSSKGQDHAAAIDILRLATSPHQEPARNLQRLLNAKSLFQYGSGRATQGAASDLLKYAARLLEEMERRLTS